MQLDMTMANNLTLFKSALANALVGARGVAGIRVESIEQIIANLRRKMDLEGALVPSVPQLKNPINREFGERGRARIGGRYRWKQSRTH